MSLNLKERKIRIWKNLFALPRGRLCFRKRATKHISDELQDNDSESVDGVHKTASLATA